MSQEKMSIHDAQQHARRWVKDLRAAKTLEGVCDAVVDAEDRIGAADLHVENAKKEVEELEDWKVQLQEENLVLEATHEDFHRQTKTLSETFVTYKKQVENDIQVLDGYLEDHTDKHNDAIKSMETRKAELVDELKTLRSKKEQIEGVIEAFRKANAAEAGD